MNLEKWVVTTKKADFNALAERFQISPMLARIIRNRDVISEEEMDYFLNGTLQDLHNPRQMYQMEAGALLLLEKIKQKRKIRVVGDYDADGICASYILKKGIQTLGGDVSITIPHRVKDGYGLNKHLVELALQDGIDTMITCDNGIAARDEIEYAKQHNMTVIVTDHHEVPYEEKDGQRLELLPPADVVINPKQQKCEYPYKGICGAVVAYKFIQVLLEEAEVDDSRLLRELLEFAAIATICDVMELFDENRIIVKYGLKYIQQSVNVGLRTLMDVCGLSDKKMTNYHIGFVIGPCLNATGRLDSAMKAISLLETDDYESARMYALALREMNEERKTMTQKGVDAAVEQIEKNGYDKAAVIVVYLKECHESIAGIIAGKIREKYYRPTLILTDGEEGLKGSGRSIEAYHMYEGLHQAEDLLDKYGGHKMAAGISIAPDKLSQLRERLNRNAETMLTEEDFIPKIKIDIPMPISYATMEFVEELELLEPFGTGNVKPLFAQKGLTVHGCRVRGKNKNVAGFMLRDSSGYEAEGIYFGEAEEFMHLVKERNNRIDVVYYPDINEFRGERKVQLVVKHFKMW